MFVKEEMIVNSTYSFILLNEKINKLLDTTINLL